MTLLSLLVKCILMLLRNCSLVSISSRFKYFHNCVSKNQDCHQYIAFRLQQENTELSLRGGRYHFHFRPGYTPARAERAAAFFCSVQRAALVLGSCAKRQKKRGAYPVSVSSTYFFRKTQRL